MSPRPAVPARRGTASAPERGAGRRVAVLAGAVLMLVAAVIGSGAAGGTPIAEAAGGALAADATPVAPAGPAFAIWSVIYAGLLSLALWQALPAQRTNARLHALDPLVVGSLLLNGAWILAVQLGRLALSVALIGALVAVLAAIYVRLVATPPAGRVEAVLLDGTMGVYLGWVAVATVANVSAWLAALGVATGRAPGAAATVAAVAALAAAGALGVALVRYSRGRAGVPLAMVWGLGWIAAGRLAGDLVSVPTAVAAIAACVAIAAATLAYRPPGHRTGSAQAG